MRVRGWNEANEGSDTCDISKTTSPRARSPDVRLRTRGLFSNIQFHNRAKVSSFSFVMMAWKAKIDLPVRLSVLFKAT